MRTPFLQKPRMLALTLVTAGRYINEPHEGDLDHCNPRADVSPFIKTFAPFMTESSRDQRDAQGNESKVYEDEPGLQQSRDPTQFNAREGSE
jgi:hypothetical protein